MGWTHLLNTLVATALLCGFLIGCGAPPEAAEEPVETATEEEGEASPLDAVQAALQESENGQNAGLASGSGAEAAPEPTARIDIDIIPDEVDTPDKAYPPDFSGTTDILSEFEMSAEAAGLANYTGIVCRITIDGMCSCSEDSATSEVAFVDANAGSWSLTLVSGSSVTFNIERLGVNTWKGSTTNEERTVSMELVFFETGFQQTTTIDITDEQQVTCTNVWTRQ